MIEAAHIYLNSPAKYWTSDFLELKEVFTDSENTRKAFKNIDIVLNKELKSKYPSDYTVIRNSVVGYMRKEIQLNYDEMIDNILKEYVPDNTTEEDIQKLKDKLLELPDKKNFERLFTVVPKEIKTRVRKLYTVNDGIEIKVDGCIEN